ncbi:hypothetical protein [Corallococcus exiguus]|uniref:hypothetical protein n=1 Tax=Corallococcus exiguus TaxID=83462 RepID=UPI0014944510|nr:hypothetical protein [Corallococcus exiguus]NPD26457.1 hypothetical protein [Corallococcus exiguus]
MNAKTFLMVASLLIAPSAAFGADGATVQPVNQKGKPVGPPVKVPDCRSCSVQRTGPTSGIITVPKPVRDKLDGQK